MHIAANVFSMLERTAESALGDRPGYGFEGEQLSFRETRDSALTIAGGLSAEGVRPGDKVAVLMGNRLEWVELYFAIAALGAVCVPINVLLTAPEISDICNRSHAKFLVTDEVVSTNLPAIDHQFDAIITVGEVTSSRPEPTTRWDKIKQSPPLPADHVGPELNDTFIIYFSSGTTGSPKGAEHTHNGVLWNAIGQIDGLALNSDKRYLVIPSLSWAAGFHNVLMTLTWLGGYSELRRLGGATMDSIVAAIEESRSTHVMLVPSLLRVLSSRDDLMQRLSESSLEMIFTGAEPVPRAVIEKVSRTVTDVDVCQGYGLSEFPTGVMMLKGAEVREHEGSAGRPLLHSDVSVRDVDGHIQRRGQGELLIRSMASMKGYYNDPVKTAEVFRDGWLHTGDLVEIDDEGFVTIIGRTKDMIISGGLNIYPKEIEDVIGRLPGVVEVAVVGIEHDQFGETPVAVVVTDGPAPGETEIEAICAENLASFKRPREIIIRTEPLPRNANAKLLKREIRPWVARQLETSALSEDFA